MLPIFDAHCDALQRALDMGHDLSGETHGHLDLAKGARGGLRAAVLTAWVDGPYADEVGASKRRTNALLDAADDLFAAAPNKIVRVTDGDALDAALAGGADDPVACVLAIEGGHAIEDDLGQLEHYASRGVRVMTLTWNNHLSWARSCRDGAGAGVPEGLNAFGREVVKRMGELGMLVDLSHAGERTFYDALECAAAPPMVSHSGCSAIAAHPRNIDDDQLRALRDCGGVLGIPFATAFLSEDEREAERAFRETDAYRAVTADSATERLLLQGDAIQKGLPPFPIEHVVRHTLHALEICGPEHVAIGSDFDGIDRRPAGLEDASGYQTLLRALADRGVDDETLAAIAHGNARRALGAAMTVTSQG
ncbi:Membrane dipeptidase (Peptidase family M19) [Planctomycetes bacterium Poly30]|uniref:Membrane dipeptidase (Peptidase family M19) n=1 Tax=Saltatorellus ferox TaxID=2528018 RepID=A0A518EMX5_9BACT|nr:Membrane dipeptidase (Peptidase family M19) [Planctomycetes bacterium Poly30]